MTSEDPFVKQIDESIMEEMGVGLDQLLNPAKVSFCWTCFDFDLNGVPMCF